MITYYVSPDMRILFIGINPHPGSYKRGVPFSNNKTFWYLLNRAGLLRERIEDLRTDDGLREIYASRFNRVYGYGLVNMVDRPSTDVTGLHKNEELPGRERIHRIIGEQRPRVVCFVGKMTYQRFAGVRACTYGWQTPIVQSKIYVMHTPLRGYAHVRIQELQEVLVEAGRLDDSSSGRSSV